MWARVAEELQVPWRAVEAMHWQLGRHDMARRAGQTTSKAWKGGGSLKAGKHTRSQSQESVGGGARASSPQSSHSSRSLRFMSRAEAAMPVALPPLPPVHSSVTLAPQSQQKLPYISLVSDSPCLLGHHVLAQLQDRPSQQSGPLPGFGELTTGVAPYSRPCSTEKTRPGESRK